VPSLADPGLPQPEQFLTINPRPRGDRRVDLEVVGHVDAFTTPLLRACLRTQLSRPVLRELVVDLGGVQFMGAAGVSALVEASQRARARRLRFRVRAHGRRGVLRPLQVAGVLEELDVETVAAPRLPVAAELTHA